MKKIVRNRIIDLLINKIKPKTEKESEGNSKNIIAEVKYRKIAVYDEKTDKPSFRGVNSLEKRYAASSIGVGYKELKKQLAVKEALYFLGNECGSYFKKYKELIKILDVGCGSGMYSKVLKSSKIFEAKVEYSGLEVSKKLIDICKAVSPGDNFFVSRADKIASMDNSYDLVLCNGTLQYTVNLWKKSIEEMKRVSQKYICILRMPVTKYNKSLLIGQKVVTRFGTENPKYVLLNRTEFEDYLRKIKLKILVRDYSTEECVIKGVNERIVLVQYLLEK